jgi:hypothetical protein
MDDTALLIHEPSADGGNSTFVDELVSNVLDGYVYASPDDETYFSDASIPSVPPLADNYDMSDDTQPNVVQQRAVSSVDLDMSSSHSGENPSSTKRSLEEGNDDDSESDSDSDSPANHQEDQIMSDSTESAEALALMTEFGPFAERMYNEFRLHMFVLGPLLECRIPPELGAYMSRSQLYLDAAAKQKEKVDKQKHRAKKGHDTPALLWMSFREAHKKFLQQFLSGMVSQFASFLSRAGPAADGDSFPSDFVRVRYAVSEGLPLVVRSIIGTTAKTVSFAKDVRDHAPRNLLDCGVDGCTFDRKLPRYQEQVRRFHANRCFGKTDASLWFDSSDSVRFKFPLSTGVFPFWHEENARDMRRIQLLVDFCLRLKEEQFFFGVKALHMRGFTLTADLAVRKESTMFRKFERGVTLDDASRTDNLVGGMYLFASRIVDSSAGFELSGSANRLGLMVSYDVVDCKNVHACYEASGDNAGTFKVFPLILRVSHADSSILHEADHYRNNAFKVGCFLATLAGKVSGMQPDTDSRSIRFFGDLLQKFQQRFTVLPHFVGLSTFCQLLFEQDSGSSWRPFDMDDFLHMLLPMAEDFSLVLDHPDIPLMCKDLYDGIVREDACEWLTGGHGNPQFTPFSLNLIRPIGIALSHFRYCEILNLTHVADLSKMVYFLLFVIGTIGPPTNPSSVPTVSSVGKNGSLQRRMASWLKSCQTYADLHWSFPQQTFMGWLSGKFTFYQMDFSIRLGLCMADSVGPQCPPSPEFTVTANGVFNTFNSYFSRFPPPPGVIVDRGGFDGDELLSGITKMFDRISLADDMARPGSVTASTLAETQAIAREVLANFGPVAKTALLTQQVLPGATLK